MKGTWSVFRLLLAVKTCTVCPQHRIRWQWQQVFPTKPSHVQGHCIASHLLPLLSEPSKPSCPSAAGASERPRYFSLGRACGGPPWPLQSRIPIPCLGLLWSETTQLSMQVMDGWQVGGTVLRPQVQVQVTRWPSYRGNTEGDGPSPAVFPAC